MPDFRENPGASPHKWYRHPRERWVDLLIAEYEAHGPKATGARLGVSAGMVTGVARGYYASSVDTIREAVRAVFGRASVDCPVLGEVELATCRHHRSRPFAATNPLRVRLYRTCRSCPNNPNA